MEIILLFNSNSSLAKKQRHCLFLLSFTEILILIMNRPLHGFCRHLGCGDSRGKNYSKCMGYCSNFNANNSAIIHRILTKKTFFKRY